MALGVLYCSSMSQTVPRMLCACRMASAKAAGLPGMEQSLWETRCPCCEELVLLPWQVVRLERALFHGLELSCQACRSSGLCLLSLSLFRRLWS